MHVTSREGSECRSFIKRAEHMCTADEKRSNVPLAGWVVRTRWGQSGHTLTTYLITAWTPSRNQPWRRPSLVSMSLTVTTEDRAEDGVSRFTVGAASMVVSSCVHQRASGTRWMHSALHTWPGWVSWSVSRRRNHIPRLNVRACSSAGLQLCKYRKAKGDWSCSTYSI